MPVDRVNYLDIPARREWPDPAGFFESIYQAFLQANKAAAGSIDGFYSIDGHTIRLCFAGPALWPQITPALEHLATERNAAPALTVCLWDSASTRTECPPLPWSEYSCLVTSSGEIVPIYRPRGDVCGYNDGRIHTHIGPNLLSVLDTKLNLAVYWCHDADQLPTYETGAPLRNILHWWMRQHGRQLIHSGAVGTPEGGVLLVGKGGTGKSTTALACVKSGLAYVSDDYCLVATDPAPYVFSLYNSAKMRLDNVHSVGPLGSADRLDSEKALFFLNRRYPGQITTGFPVRAILIPRVTGRVETELTPALPTMAFKAIALSTLRQLAGAGQAAIQTIDQLVKQVPSYHLELGTDLPSIPDVIAGLLPE